MHFLRIIRERACLRFPARAATLLARVRLVCLLFRIEMRL